MTEHTILWSRNGYAAHFDNGWHVHVPCTVHLIGDSVDIRHMDVILADDQSGGVMFEHTRDIITRQMYQQRHLCAEDNLTRNPLIYLRLRVFYNNLSMEWPSTPSRSSGSSPQAQAFLDRSARRRSIRGGHPWTVPRHFQGGVPNWVPYPPSNRRNSGF